MTAPAHPHWCDSSACEAGAVGGLHRSTTARINLKRNEPPRLLLMLTMPAGGPVRIRLVAISDILVNEVSLSVDEGALTAATLSKLVKDAAPPDV